MVVCFMLRDKKVLFGCFGAVVMLLLVNFSSVIGSFDKEYLLQNPSFKTNAANILYDELILLNEKINIKGLLNESKLVNIEINKYLGRKPEIISKQVSEKQALEIVNLLYRLTDSIEKKDKVSILHYENLLNKKGIFGDKYYKFYLHDQDLWAPRSKNSFDFNKFINKINSKDISNKMCYFHSLGAGSFYFTLEKRLIDFFYDTFDNSDSILEIIALFLVFLPFIVVVSVISHMIPFRILLPVGEMNMEKGKMFSLGVDGFKDLIVENNNVSVSIRGFSGITINVPLFYDDLGGDILFISGFAFEVSDF